VSALAPDSGSPAHRFGVRDARFSTMRWGLGAGARGQPLGDGQFSFFDRDPLFELQRAARLAGGRHQILPRFLILAAAGVLPPLVETALGRGPLPALLPLLTRFLVAVPVLLWAERFVDHRVRAAVTAFTERGLVRPADLGRFRSIVAETDRLLHAPRAAIAIVAVAFALSPLGSALGLQPPTPARWWVAYVSLPLFRVVLLQWLWRWLVWVLLLTRASRLDLRLEPTHPDLAAGLGFLEHAATAFLSLQVAVGAVVAGRLLAVAVRGGAPVDKPQIAGFALFTVVMTLGPLAPFSRSLLRAKRLGKLDYGRLASRHNQRFADRWLGGTTADPLGDPAISSLADLGTSYGAIDRMRPLPIGRLSLILLLVVCAAPALPALATHVPFRDMLARVVKTVLL
jgi:hypothetical protein